MSVKEISNEAYNKAIALNDNIANSVISVDINDVDLHVPSNDETVYVFVEVRLVTA